MHNPLALDTRAIGLGRLLIGAYALMDIYARLTMSGGLDWYTSSSENVHAAIRDSDTPHGAWVHKILFYRGTEQFQIAVFSLHIVIALLYTMGWKTYITSWLLWFATMCMHGRQECFHDGSDKYFRNLLLWSCFLPLDRSFTFLTKNKESDSSFLHFSTGSIGYVLQVCLMYFGVVAQRYLRGTSWFPSDGTAVYYALGGSFASRPPGTMLTMYPSVCYYMTIFAIVGELSIPLFILLTSPTTKLRWLAIMAAVGVHIGIFILFYLPQWQLIAIIGVIPLIPSSLFSEAQPLHTTAQEHVQNQESSPKVKDVDRVDEGGMDADGSLRRRKIGLDNTDKTEINTTATSEDKTNKEKNIKKARKKTFSLKAIIAGFLVLYMLMEWGSTDGELYKSPDHGDIGQILRFYQGWVMFSNPTASARQPWFEIIASTVSEGGTSSEKLHVFDVLQGMKGNWTDLEQTEVEVILGSKPDCVSCIYPSWRYERFLYMTAQATSFQMEQRMQQLVRHWCYMLKKGISKSYPDTSFDFERLSIRFKVFDYYILPPNEDGIPQEYRVSARPRADTELRCSAL